MRASARRASAVSRSRLLLGGNLVAAVATCRRASARGRLFREGLLLLVPMAVLAFAVCALAQAPPDLSRALYAYHALCDLLIVADAGWIAEAIARSVRRKRAGATSVLYEPPGRNSLFLKRDEPARRRSSQKTARGRR